MTEPLIRLLVTLIQIYSLVLVARIVMSWLPNLDRRNPVVDFLYRITDPVLEPVRQLIPPLGAIDISPIIVFVGLRLLQRLLLNMGGGF